MVVYVCQVCHFEATVDDCVTMNAATGHCICLRCFNRECGTTPHVSKRLQREINQEEPELCTKGPMPKGEGNDSERWLG